MNFKSVADIQSSAEHDNQFFVLMNSEDQPNAPLDTLLLFQFARPQSLVSFWKFLIPVRQMKLVSFSSRAFLPSGKRKQIEILVLINKNDDIQKIYCGVSKGELATYKKRQARNLNRS